MIGTICTPALIYLIFSISQVLIDTVKGFFNTALVKIILTIVFTFILNYLCNAGLGILSWIIVFIPFILMTVIVALLLFVFNLDPKTGRMIRANKPDESIKRDLILYHEHQGRHDGKKDCDKCNKNAKKEQKPFYKFKLDTFNNNEYIKPSKYSNFDSEYTKRVNIPAIRDQRLAQYV
jgi:predicted membrane protein